MPTRTRSLAPKTLWGCVIKVIPARNAALAIPLRSGSEAGLTSMGLCSGISNIPRIRYHYTADLMTNNTLGLVGGLVKNLERVGLRTWPDGRPDGRRACMGSKTTLG